MGNTPDSQINPAAYHSQKRQGNPYQVNQNANIPNGYPPSNNNSFNTNHNNVPSNGYHNNQHSSDGDVKTKEQPQQSYLQQYEIGALEVFNSEAMNVCWVFWKDNVDILPRNRQKEVALLLYCHMFQKIPTARRLFIRGEIEEQALKFLDMFGYLIRQLKDFENQNSLLKTLQSLGKRHMDWGVRSEFFEPMLNSLHSALSDHFKHTYTVRVKFCMEQIFTSAANVMTGQDLNHIFHERNHIGDLSFLESLEQCLADRTGKEYLERFLVQSFCAELVEFEKYYKQYKGALSDTERYYISQTILKKFLTPNAKNELNIKTINNHDIKHKIVKKIDKIQNNKGTHKSKKNDYPQDLFDPVHNWVMQQIEHNSWSKFKSIILSIAVQKRTAATSGVLSYNSQQN